MWKVLQPLLLIGCASIALRFCYLRELRARRRAFDGFHPLLHRFMRICNWVALTVAVLLAWGLESPVFLLLAPALFLVLIQLFLPFVAGRCEWQRSGQELLLLEAIATLVSSGLTMVGALQLIQQKGGELRVPRPQRLWLKRLQYSGGPAQVARTLGWVESKRDLDRLFYRVLAGEAAGYSVAELIEAAAITRRIEWQTLGKIQEAKQRAATQVGFCLCVPWILWVARRFFFPGSLAVELNALRTLLLAVALGQGGGLWLLAKLCRF